jgi:hypothetical protein
MIPVINNINPKPLYNGVPVTIGETPEHRALRPVIKKGKKKTPILLIGASTPSQIFEELVKKNTLLTDCVFIHAGHGAQDINDYLDMRSAGWSTIKSAVAAAGYTLKQIKWVIMCHDDLKDASNSFPTSANTLADKEIAFVKLMKSSAGGLTSLKVIDIFSRLSAVTITDPKFASPSDYHTCFAAKFAVETSFRTNHLIDGVWITDAPSMWTDGETVRSDGFYFRRSWAKPDGSPHLNPGEGRVYLANWLFNYCKRYTEFK